MTPTRPRALSPELLLRLQATAGNRAVQRLVKRLTKQQATSAESDKEQIAPAPVPAEAEPHLPSRLDGWRQRFWRSNAVERRLEKDPNA